MLDAIQKLVPWVGTLSSLPKALLSLAIVAIAAFALAVIWVPQRQPTNKDQPGIWPALKTMESLKQRLDRLSETNAKILRVVAGAGQYGIYVNEISSAVGLPRDQIVYRLKELEAAGLVEVVSLTDLNARVHEDVTKLLGANARNFLTAYFK